MNTPKLRWGILGAANIARKNWRAIYHAGNATVAAVASRDLERTRRFITDCQAEAPMERVPVACESYAALLGSGEVDAVYIPLPTGVRKEWVLRAAEAGKHVLCEKPCGASLADLEEMLAACRRHNVQFMDGVMFMHSRRLVALRAVLDQREGGMGELRRITSAFCFPASPEFFVQNIRAHAVLEPTGCLGDLGWYCIRFALWVVNWQMPVSVTGRLLSACRRPDSPTAVPSEFSGELVFANGVSASHYSSFVTGHEQWAVISGARGCVRLADFVLPFHGSQPSFERSKADFHVRGGDFRMEDRTVLHTVEEASHNHPTAQESLMFRAFADQVRTGHLNGLWPEAAWKTQAVMSACLESAAANGVSVKPAQASPGLVSTLSRGRSESTG